MLNMGDGATLCVLSGAAVTKKALIANKVTPLFKLPEVCTAMYKTTGFVSPVAARVGSKNGDGGKFELDVAAAKFQLMLTGKDMDEVALWTSHTGEEAEISISLDGITFGNTGGSGHEELLGEDGALPTTQDLQPGMTVAIDGNPKGREEYIVLGLEDGKVALFAGHQSPPWYPLEVKKQAGGKVALKTKSGYCSNTGGDDVRCDSSQVSAAQTFTFRCVQNCDGNSGTGGGTGGGTSGGSIGAVNTTHGGTGGGTSGGSIGAVNTTQPGFAAQSVLKPTKNMVVMGPTMEVRTCVLKGVIDFTAVNNEAIAHLDPNYRDPKTKVPFCFPMASLVFFAGVVESDRPDAPIQKVVPIQIEPHGRLKLIGVNSNTKVRVDNIMYHPVMKFNKSPSSCAPYCFPDGKMGGQKLGMSGCVKACTPTQYISQEDTTQKLSECECDMLKRLDCFYHDGSSQIRCGQVKKLMAMSTPQCTEICAGQLAAF